MKTLFALLALACIVDAHVVLSYVAETGYVRNAAGASKTKPAAANGQPSVDGACGGSTTFGANGVTTTHNPGDTLTFKINYSGGHADPNNVFKAAFACAGDNNGKAPTQSTMNLAKRVTAGVPAPNGEGGGPYTVTMQIPATANGQCTASVLDQRNWGGCVDMQIGTATTAAGAPPNGPGAITDGGSGASATAVGAAVAVVVVLVVGVIAVVLFMAYKGIGPMRGSALHRKMAGNNYAARPSSSSNQNFAQPAYTEEGYSAPASTPGRPMSNRAPPSAPVSSRPPPQSVRAAPVSSRPPPGRANNF